MDLKAIAAVTLIMAFAGLLLLRVAPSSADPGGCPNEHASTGWANANSNSAHGEAKQSDRGCTNTSPPEPTPAPTPEPTPVPGADVKVVSTGLASPVTGTTGSTFLVSASANLHNNGPASSVNVDTTFTLTPPAGCTAPTNSLTVTILNKPLPFSTSVFMMRTWNIVCSVPGDHEFRVDVSTAITPGQAWSDPNPANNSGFATSMTTVSAPTPTPAP